MEASFNKYACFFLLTVLSHQLQATSSETPIASCQLLVVLSSEPETGNWRPETSIVHPVHISVTEINYSEKDKALQIISRLFIDDLELSIRAMRKDPNLDLMDPKGTLTTKQLVMEYLIEHFQVKLDGKATKMNFLAVEKEDLSLICYIEIANVKKIKTLEVFNDTIMATHEDQSNLVHVTFKSPVKSARLVYSKPSEKFTFETK
jgi:hypothetical protein